MSCVRSKATAWPTARRGRTTENYIAENKKGHPSAIAEKDVVAGHQADGFRRRLEPPGDGLFVQKPLGFHGSRKLSSGMTQYIIDAVCIASIIRSMSSPLPLEGIRCVVLLLGLVSAGTAHRAALAEVVLETRNLRLEIRDDGLLKSLVAKPSATEYGWLAAPAPVASIRRGKQTFADGPVELLLPVDRDHLALMRPFGKRLPLRTGDDGMTIVPIGNRRYLKFSDMGVDRVRQILCDVISSPVYH